MNFHTGICVLLALSCMLTNLRLDAQNIPSSLSFTTVGSFTGAVAEGNNSVLRTDNNLTNGYSSGFDLHDAPTGLKTTGPTGSAAFQWGEAASSSWAYPHSSALWFEPVAVKNVVAEQTFTIANLYYRNGTIKNNTGASWVNLMMTLNFSTPTGLDPMAVTFGNELINTDNGNDPNNVDQVAASDIVNLKNLYTPLNFQDSNSNKYYLELTFQVDEDTIDGTLSTAEQFRVFEGKQGRATLLGRFTTTPASVVPEPSSAMLCLIGSLLAFRRKRD